VTPAEKETHRRWYYYRGGKAIRKKYQRRYIMKKKFGLSLEEADKLLATNCCGICGTTNPGKREWQIDHNHRTKTVRGILCAECNLGIGKFKDDPVLLRSAALWCIR
jgi:Recombination endonuclease VII